MASPKPVDFVAVTAIQPGEGLEDPFTLGSGHARALVSDRDSHMTRAMVGYTLNGDGQLSAGG